MSSLLSCRVAMARKCLSLLKKRDGQAKYVRPCSPIYRTPKVPGLPPYPVCNGPGALQKGSSRAPLSGSTPCQELEECWLTEGYDADCSYSSCPEASKSTYHPRQSQGKNLYKMTLRRWRHKIANLFTRLNDWRRVYTHALRSHLHCGNQDHRHPIVLA